MPGWAKNQRRTFASILVAVGGDPGSVMDQLGYTDPGFTLRVYRHGMRREPGEREHLAELVAGAQAPPRKAAPVTPVAVNPVSAERPPVEMPSLFLTPLA